MKKLVALLLFVSLFLAAVPKTAFCDDGHNDSPVACHHHCTLTCHNHLINADAVAPIVLHDKFLVVASPDTSTFSYQNPTVDRFKRPPIYLS